MSCELLVLHQFGFYLISLIYYFNVAPELSTFSFAVFVKIDIFGIYLVSMSFIKSKELQTAILQSII